MDRVTRPRCRAEEKDQEMPERAEQALCCESTMFASLTTAVMLQAANINVCFAVAVFFTERHVRAMFCRTSYGMLQPSMLIERQAGEILLPPHRSVMLLSVRYRV